MIKYPSKKVSVTIPVIGDNKIFNRKAFVTAFPDKIPVKLRVHGSRSAEDPHILPAGFTHHGIAVIISKVNYVIIGPERPEKPDF